MDSVMEFGIFKLENRVKRPLLYELVTREF